MTDELRVSAIALPPEGGEPQKPRLLEHAHEAIRRLCYAAALSGGGVGLAFGESPV